LIAFFTMIFAGIAAWPIAHDWLWPPAKKDVQNESVLVPQMNESPTTSAIPPGATMTP
jgi:hypothetical protein